MMHAGLGLASFAAFKGTVALVGTVVYVASFALGAGAVPGLLVPEITPAHLRGTLLLGTDANIPCTQPCSISPGLCWN